jgi:hypothetical protein
MQTASGAIHLTLTGQAAYAGLSWTSLTTGRSGYAPLTQPLTEGAVYGKQEAIFEVGHAHRCGGRAPTANAQGPDAIVTVNGIASFTIPAPGVYTVMDPVGAVRQRAIAKQRRAHAGADPPWRRSPLSLPTSPPPPLRSRCARARGSAECRRAHLVLHGRAAADHRLRRQLVHVHHRRQQHHFLLLHPLGPAVRWQGARLPAISGSDDVRPAVLTTSWVAPPRTSAAALRACASSRRKSAPRARARATWRPLCRS